MRPQWLSIALLAPLLLSAGTLAPGRNRVPVRGQDQSLYFYPASGAARGTVLFLSGDGGWRGFAVEMGRNLAEQGYNVYGWDIKEYLSGFTGSTAALTEALVAADTATLARRIAPGPGSRITLVGWSQGAAMALLAAGDPGGRELYCGLVAIGMPESAVLGWRFVDNLSYVTRREPNEPHFTTRPYMAKVAPLRLALVHSSQDEYTTPEAVRRLFDQAQEPKRLVVVPAQNHRYDGNHDDFFLTLREQVQWVSANAH